MRGALINLFVGLALVGLRTSLAEAQPYQDYARRAIAEAEAVGQVRSDLETALDRLAAAYRRGHGRQPLETSELLRLAARAQAADMMFLGRSGHASRAGHRFEARFAAFAGDPELYRARGENAASDRRKGPPDEAKAKRLFSSWLASSSHRRNLMSRDYAYVSTGVVQRGDELWAVQIFWSAPIAPGPLTQ